MSLDKTLVPKFLKRNAFDLLMFGYVDGIHTEFPSVSIKKAIEMFRSRYNLTLEEFNDEGAYATYHRMKAEFKDFSRAKV